MKACLQNVIGGRRESFLILLKMVRAGHEVTLFGSGDSVTGARLIAPCRQSLRKNERCKDPVAREVILIDHVVEHAREFDLIHFHMSYLHFAITCHLPVPHVATLHGRLDMLPRSF